MTRRIIRFFRQYWFVSFIVVFGLLASVSAGLEAANVARAKADARFSFATDLLIDRIKAQFSASLDASQDLAALAQASYFVDSDFARFVGANQELSRFRQLVGTVVSLPETDSSLGLGFLDLWVQSSIDEEQFEASLQNEYEEIFMFVKKVRKFGVPSAIPMEIAYQNLYAMTNAVLFVAPIDLPGDELGYGAQIVDLKQLLGYAIAEDAFKNLNVRVSSVDRTGMSHSYEHIRASGQEISQANSRIANLIDTQSFSVGAQIWTATVWGNREEYPVELGQTFLFVLGGLTLTGLTAFVVWTQSLRAQRVIEMVDRRTRALKQAHVELEDQNRLLRDLNSDLSMARKSAEAASTAKSEFLATVSHELRTPLNAILGFSQILGDQALGEMGDPRYVDYAKDIHESGAHLLGLINDILDLAKLEAGKLKIERHVVDPMELAEQAKNILQQFAKDKGIYLNIEFDETLPSGIIGDTLRLRQILLNFGSNAIKFTQEGGVTIRVLNRPFATGAPGWTLEVEDTGIGIPANKISTLFDRFTQVDAAHSRSYSGAGLGLAICRELVTGMGGILNIHSNVGEGTVIWAHLPLEDAVSYEGELEDMTI